LHDTARARQQHVYGLGRRSNRLLSAPPSRFSRTACTSRERVPYTQGFVFTLHGNCPSLNRAHRVAFVVERALVQVAGFGLEQEEEQVPLLVRRARRDEQAPRGRVPQTPRQRRAHLVVAFVLVRDPVFPHHQHAAGPVRAPRHRQEHERRAAHGLGPFANHVVEPEVQLVVSQVLFSFFCGFPGRVQVSVSVLQLKRRKHLRRKKQRVKIGGEHMLKEGRPCGDRQYTATSGVNWRNVPGFRSARPPPRRSR